MKPSNLYPEDRLPVAVLGATGAIGQRFVQLLDKHPWFQVTAVTGSDRTVGKLYSETCHWLLPAPMPGWAEGLTVLPSTPEAVQAPLIFSSLPSEKAWELEPQFAKSGSVVCSNASAYRTEVDVPLLLPEVNPEHTNLVHAQRHNRNWTGYIVTNPNCTITGLTIALRALIKRFGLRKVLVVSLQAISGAGYPGIPSMDILGNVIPFIEGEESKMEWEPLKMLGALQSESIQMAEFSISAHANRVPVQEGHMVCLSVELGQPSSLDEVLLSLSEYHAPEISRDLPSSPRPVICVRAEDDRPQPRLDLMTGEGMTTVVGRVRPDTIFDYKMVILSHNTIRGAAGASIYNAELLVRQGLLEGFSR